MLKTILLTVSCLLLISFTVTGQIKDSSKTFLHAAGIHKDKTTYLETEGYAIAVQDYNLAFNDKDINRLKKYLSTPKDAVEQTDNNFPGARIYISRDDPEKSNSTAILYLLKNKEGKIKKIGFSTGCERDPAIEKEIYDAIVSNTIPDYVFAPMRTDSISFAGRRIGLGGSCSWMSLHNLQCPGNGQMNWSEFSSRERAEQMVKAQQRMVGDKHNLTVLEEKEVPVIFEGSQVTAYRMKVKFKIPTLIMGGSNILIAYYVTAAVRGRYVGCVLSYYTDKEDTAGPAALLNEVMQLKD